MSLSFFAMTSLAFTYLFSRAFKKLDKLIIQIDKVINEFGGRVFRSFWEGFDAEIQMFRKQKPQALNWLKNAQEIPLVPISNFSDPHLSMIRILLMEGSQEFLKKANIMMDKVEELVIRTNNHRVTATIYVGKAIYFHKMHDLENCVAYVNKALQIAELGNNVMVFVEYGKSAIPTLRHYIKQKGEHELLTKALALIEPEDTLGEQPIFTNRELEIILLLNLPNKEIAEKLFIAEKTVKRIADKFDSIDDFLSATSDLENLKKRLSEKIIPQK